MAEPSEGRARLLVRRTAKSDNRIRSIFVSLDGGAEKGLHFGDSAQLSITPGRHTLRATNRLFTKTETFEARPDETAAFQVISTSGGCFLLFAVIGVPACTLVLERTEA